MVCKKVSFLIEIKNFLRFIKHIYNSKNLLFELANNDFKQQYFGSYLGLVWAFIQPVAMILIMWFVFQVGFKAQPINNVPFILWLSAGMIPWFFFADSVSQGTNAITSNSFLVKKVVFRVSILPITKIINALKIHLFFVVFLMAMFIYYGYMPTLYWLQLPYYILLTTILTLGITWLTSSLIVFLKDVGQLITLLLQFGFWLTPIFWPISMVPEKYLYLIKLNPMFYIVSGYRNAFIDNIWFWETYKVTPYFLITTSLIFITGALIFKRLRPHFADVL